MKIAIPTKSLRLPVGMAAMSVGEGEEESVMPEVNDPVSFSVEGVVTSINGETAEVDVRFVNGERPSTEGKKNPKAEDAESTDEELEALAAAADEGEDD